MVLSRALVPHHGVEVLVPLSPLPIFGLDVRGQVHGIGVQGQQGKARVDRDCQPVSAVVPAPVVGRAPGKAVPKSIGVTALGDIRIEDCVGTPFKGHSRADQVLLTETEEHHRVQAEALAGGLQGFQVRTKGIAIDQITRSRVTTEVQHVPHSPDVIGKGQSVELGFPGER